MTDSKLSDSGFRAIAANYWRSIQAYREFQAHVSDTLAELAEEEDPGQWIDPVAQDLDEEQREELASVLDQIAEFAESSGNGEDGTGETTDDEVDPDDQEEGPAARRGKGGLQLKMSPEVTRAFVRAVQKLERRIPVSRHQELLYQSVITGLVGQFEVLVSDIAHQFYRYAPGAVATDEKVLSVNELREFGDVEEALDFVVDKRVEDLLRSSPEGWRHFFQSRLNLNLEECTPEWEYWNEFIQRRHIIVHSGARISRRYLANVSDRVLEEYFEDPELGTKVSLSGEYVGACLTAFEATGLRLAFASWHKLFEDEGKQLGNLLLRIVYDALQSHRWKLTLHLASWGLEHATISEEKRNVCRMNRWLSLKRLGQWEDIEDQVREFDVSALHPRFAAVRAGLLEEPERFRSVIRRNDGAGLDEEAWTDWPVFDDIRETAEFQECWAEFGPEVGDDARGGDAESSDEMKGENGGG